MHSYGAIFVKFCTVAVHFEQKRKISTAEMGAHRQKQALNEMVLELLID